MTFLYIIQPHENYLLKNEYHLLNQSERIEEKLSLMHNFVVQHLQLSLSK